MATIVEGLKAQGNALHVQGNYRAAYQKYSEAIQENPDGTLLAVLYANRAACCLAMKEYLDAMHDGTKAAKVDPTYAKAWARIATAAHVLELWDQSRVAWKSGLACLPATGLTPAQVVLQTQFEAGLKAVDTGEAKAQALAESGRYTRDISGLVDDMPWNRALALAEEEKLAKGDAPSSGWAILNAYRDFIRGMTNMGQGNSPGVLSDITNGILRDKRVFHAHSEFFEQLQKQMRFEAELTGAWAGGGPKQIQKEVPQRLRKSGWLPVRRALAVTIRIWIMRGYLDSNMGVLNGGVEFYKRTLEVLEWGRRTYPNVPSEDRGAIFEASFVRGVRRLYIPAVLSLYMKNGDASGYTLDDIGQMARELKAETEASERSPLCALDPGFYASFWVYPIAEALSILGWYHMQLGLRCLDRVVSGEEEDLDPASADDFEKSAQYYIQAADKYPSDDEERPYMLAVAVEALWWSGTPLRDTLPLCRRVQAAMSEAAGIWERSQKGRSGNPVCESAVEFLASTERQLAEGTATLDEALMPADLMERRVRMIAHIQEG